MDTEIEVQDTIVERQVAAEQAQIIAQQITAMQRALDATFLDLGERISRMAEVVIVEAEKGRFETSVEVARYKLLEYDSLEAFLASPEINVGVRTGFAAMGAYRVFVEQFDLPRHLLIDVGIAKLELIRPYVTSENVHAYVNSASTLSRSDVQTWLKEMLQTEGKEIDESINPELRPLFFTWDEEPGFIYRRTITYLLNKLIESRPELHNDATVRVAREVLVRLSKDDKAN